MFITLISFSSGHLRRSIIALPRTRMFSFGCLFGIRALFITKAMPALEHGLFGLLDGRRLKFFPKHLLMHSTRLSSRWVSCRASIAILFFLSV